jgi:hypothetical protein
MSPALQNGGVTSVLLKRIVGEPDERLVTEAIVALSAQSRSDGRA